jgi:hypothetical protein
VAVAVAVTCLQRVTACATSLPTRVRTCLCVRVSADGIPTSQLQLWRDFKVRGPGHSCVQRCADAAVHLAHSCWQPHQCCLDTSPATTVSKFLIETRELHCYRPTHEWSMPQDIGLARMVMVAPPFSNCDDCEPAPTARGLFGRVAPVPPAIRVSVQATSPGVNCCTEVGRAGLSLTEPSVISVFHRTKGSRTSPRVYPGACSAGCWSPSPAASQLGEPACPKPLLPEAGGTFILAASATATPDALKLDVCRSRSWKTESLYRWRWHSSQISGDTDALTWIAQR